MIDLSDICGLPIFFDSETGEIIFSENIATKKEVDVAISEISQVLLNKFIKYPEKVYRHYYNVHHPQHSSFENISLDLINMPHGLLGIEYIKSHIFYSDEIKDKYACIVQVVVGELTVIIQKNSPNNDIFAYTTPVDQFDIVKVAEGEILAIPTGVYYVFVNSASKNVVFTVIYSENLDVLDYTRLNKEKGLAYYIISKNGKVEIVANPKYRCPNGVNQVCVSELEEKSSSTQNPNIFRNQADKALFNIFKNELEALSEVLV